MSKKLPVGPDYWELVDEIKDEFIESYPELWEKFTNEDYYYEFQNHVIDLINDDWNNDSIIEEYLDECEDITMDEFEEMDYDDREVIFNRFSDWRFDWYADDDDLKNQYFSEDLKVHIDTFLDMYESKDFWNRHLSRMQTAFKHILKSMGY